MECHKISSVPFSIKDNLLLSRIGGNKAGPVSLRMKKLMKKANSEIRRAADPKALFRISRVERNNGTLLVSGQPLMSKKIRKIFTPCHKAAVFLVTLGNNVDRLIRKTMKKRSCYGYILDAAASVAAESMAVYVQNFLKEKIEEEEELTLRYSPGYCDWPLKEQKKIFTILPNEQIGVTISDNYFMDPRKSISGVVGICDADSLKHGGNACLGCKNTDCIYRRN